MTSDRTEGGAPVTVRMFGTLRAFREAAGEASTVKLDVPAEGTSARVLGERLGLDTSAIEGAFVNHVLLPLDCEVHSGDRVAFVPYGTPGPHRLYLGLYEAGVATRRAETCDPRESE